MNNLQKLVRAFCDANGVKYTFVASFIGCDQKKFMKWLSGRGKLDEDQQRKVMEFLDGKFLKSLDKLVTIAG